MAAGRRGGRHAGWLALVVLASRCAVALGSKVDVVVSIDLSTQNVGSKLRESEVGFALAYVLNDPGANVLAVAAGFSKMDQPFYVRMLATHPCKAAETFLQEVGRPGVPVVCASSSGAFLAGDEASEGLARLARGSGNRGVTWLALDSWSAPAAVLSSGSRVAPFIREVILPAPADQRGVALWIDLPEGAPQLNTARDIEAAKVLRRWQEASDDGGSPKLAVMWRDSGSRLPAVRDQWELIKQKCPHSWLGSKAGRGHPLMAGIQRMFITLFTSGVWKWLTPQPLMALMFAREETALAAAVAVSRHNTSAQECAELLFSSDSDAVEKWPCGSRRSGPDGVLVRSMRIDEAMMTKIAVQVLCGISLPSTGEEL